MMEQKRSWKARLLELFLWFLLSLVIAGVLVLLSEGLLPANF